MSAHPKPVLVVTRPIPLEALPLAAETIETQTAVGMLALDNIDAVLAGSPAPSLVVVGTHTRPRTAGAVNANF